MLDSFEDCEYIYVCHASNPDNIFEIKVSVITDNSKGRYKSKLLYGILEHDKSIMNKKTPVVINYGDYNSFLFIIQYIDFYNTIIKEYESPRAPLDPELSLQDILSDEYIVFKPLIDMKDVSKHVIMRNLIHMADYMYMETLQEKLCAIEAFFIAELDDSDNREELLDFLKKSFN